MDFKRYLWDKISWKNRFIAITGARGVGKTTLLLQYIKENLNRNPEDVIYVSMDDLFFSKNSIVDFADAFVKRGGKYLFLLERADLLMLLQSRKKGISRMNKPDKVYLNNTNLMYALSDTTVNTGTLRETFLYNQLQEKYPVRYTESGDFLLAGKHTIEVGGRNKTRKQVRGIDHAFIAADNIEYAHNSTIPLWLFGFLY